MAARNHPLNFAEFVGAVITFADPLTAGEVQGLTWHPDSKSWQAP